MGVIYIAGTSIAAEHLYSSLILFISCCIKILIHKNLAVEV
jgi:hypothetical protein